MAKSNPSFMKRLREQKKRLKQEEKQRRKEEREQAKTDGTFLDGATDIVDELAEMSGGEPAAPDGADSNG